jgi:hypothetical protein
LLGLLDRRPRKIDLRDLPALFGQPNGVGAHAAPELQGASKRQTAGLGEQDAVRLGDLAVHLRPGLFPEFMFVVSHAKKIAENTKAAEFIFPFLLISAPQR